jgi:RHS repeat-associated protein
VATFIYDADGNKVAQINNGVATYYFMGGSYEVTGEAVRKYYAFGGEMVAMHDASGLKYLLTDHLGSVVATTNESGALVEQQRYLPFGGVRTDLEVPPYSITTTDHTYTGQQAIPSLGLSDYRARQYDPLLMRFVQADSLVPGATNPQAWNRYAYVLNDPIRYDDPSGHDVCNEDGYCFGRNGKYRNPRRTEPLRSNFYYEGPIPPSLSEQLVKAGADPKVLQPVTVHVYNDPEAVAQDINCRGSAAYTVGVDVYFCTPSYYNITEPTPTLVHELIHVRQVLENPAFDPEYFLAKIALTIIYRGNKRLVHNKNPFEAEAMTCEGAVRTSQESNQGLPPLNTETCDLTWP